MIYKSLILRNLLVFTGLIFSFSLLAQENVDEGKALFKANCAQCHNKNMKDDLTGPALGGINERWSGKEDLLYDWIRNSQEVIASGDEYANEIYNKWGKSLMNPFPNLTDEQIANMLFYIQCTYDGSCGPKKDVTVNGAAASASGGGMINSTLLYVLLIFILAVLALVFKKIISNLEHIDKVSSGVDPGAKKNMV